MKVEEDGVKVEEDGVKVEEDGVKVEEDGVKVVLCRVDALCHSKCIAGINLIAAGLR